MLVTPLPGVGAEAAIRVLRDVHAAALNARGAHSGPGAVGPTDGYLRWANEALRRLRTTLRPADLDRLILTRGYWALQAHGPVAVEMVPPLRAFVDLELEWRISELDIAIADLEQRRDQWDRVGLFMVADTSFYIEAAQKLEDFDFAELLDVRDDRLHLLVPILVLDELDRQKIRGSDSRRRWRAAYALSLITRCLAVPDRVGRLRAEDYSALREGRPEIPRGEITVEVVLDPPGHVRLPNNDEEVRHEVARDEWTRRKEGRLMVVSVA